MLKISNLEVFNVEGALRGMRQPYKVTEASDSDWELSTMKAVFHMGGKDLKLARALIRQGSPHDKFLRQIFVTMDITAPLYWWKQMSTYKVGTTANSESTMHTITKFPFTKEMFAFDESYVNEDSLEVLRPRAQSTILEAQIELLNNLRNYYLKEEDPNTKVKLWRTIVQVLPCNYLQQRTWTGNYRILRSIIEQRQGHKLVEWQEFIEEMKTIEYSKEFLFD